MNTTKTNRSVVSALALPGSKLVTIAGRSSSRIYLMSHDGYVYRKPYFTGSAIRGAEGRGVIVPSPSAVGRAAHGDGWTGTVSSAWSLTSPPLSR